MTRNISYSQYNNQQVPQSQLMSFNQNQQNQQNQQYQAQQSILRNPQSMTQTTSKMMKQSSSSPYQMKETIS